MTPRTDEELRKFAIDFVDGHIFTSDMIPNVNEIGLVFMVFALGAAQKMPEEEIKELGLIYEYMDKAMRTRSINGMPIFFSAQLMSKEDCKRAQVFVDEYRKMKATFFAESKQ